MEVLGGLPQLQPLSVAGARVAIDNSANTSRLLYALKLQARLTRQVWLTAFRCRGLVRRYKSLGPDKYGNARFLLSRAVKL